jgi:hypothetical protein
MNMQTTVNPGVSLGTSQAANEWIDRYVNEVGRRLPSKQRTDVEREIRSLIEDEVAGRLDAAEGEDSAQADLEATVLAVLEQFGSPKEMAARYQAPRYLISPAMFPIFQIVLSIVLAVTIIASLFGVVVAAGTGGPAEPFVDTILGLFGSIIQALGTVTLIFVALERLGVAADGKPEAWNPRSLPPVKDPQRLNIIETVVDIGFTAAILLLAVNYLNSGTGPVFYNNEWQAIPIFTPELLQYLPWLIVLWGADILVNIVLLARGRWEPATRIATMLTSGAAAFILYQILIGGPIAAWPPLEPAFKVTVAIIFAVSLWEVVRQGWQLLHSSAWTAGTLRSQHVA